MRMCGRVARACVCVCGWHVRVDKRSAPVNAPTQLRDVGAPGELEYRGSLFATNAPRAVHEHSFVLPFFRAIRGDLGPRVRVRV